NLLTRFSDQIKDHGVIERAPLLEGKSMHITVASTHKPKVAEPGAGPPARPAEAATPANGPTPSATPAAPTATTASATVSAAAPAAARPAAPRSTGTAATQ
ncbi:MAG TPA: hypothetical protein VIV06_03975, partial [Candidatus Limnocylindrales bacterium]